MNLTNLMRAGGSASQLKSLARALVIAMLGQTIASAGDFTGGHSKGQTVSLIRANGKIITIREKYKIRDLQIASDGMTAAWQLVNTRIDDAAPLVSSDILVIYRIGKRRTITCGPMIRDFWFWERGRQIAYDCGGLHFGGNNVLLDTATLRAIASFHDHDVPFEERPRWANEGPTHSANVLQPTN